MHKIVTKIGGFYHMALTKRDLAKGATAYAAAHPKHAAKVQNAIDSLEVVWKLKGGLFREFLIINGVGELTKLVPCVRSKGEILLQVVVRNDTFAGVRHFRIKELDHRLKFEDRDLPLSYEASEREFEINIDSVTGMNAHWLCCGACFYVHDRLDIHSLDCLCCMFGCDYHCWM